MATPERIPIILSVDGEGASKQAEKSIGSIRKQLKEANGELIAAQRNFGEYSKEAIAAAKRVAQLRDSIQDARETADLFDPGKKFQAFSGALQAVAGGFAAVQGALGLLGVESEDVEKQLLKVQSALALSEGLSRVTDSAKDFARLGAVIKTQVVTAFSTLRGAIIATGIGALAVGLGLLVSNFDAVVAAIRKVIPGIDSFIGGIKRAVTAVTDFVGITSEAERQLESLTNASKARNEEIERTIKVLSAQGGKEKEIATLTKERVNNEIADIDRKEKAGQKLTEAEIKQRKDLQTELQVIDAQETKRLQGVQEERNKNAKAAQEARLAEQKAINEQLREEERKRIDEEIADVKRINDLRAEANKIRTDAEREAILARLSERDREFQELEFKFADQIAKFQGDFLARLNIEQAYLLERNALRTRLDIEETETATKNVSTRLGIQVAALDAETESRSKNTKAQIELDQKKKEAFLNNAQGISSALGAAATLFGKQTVAGKIAAIAQATIDTFVSANRAYQALAGIPVVGPALGAAAAGVAVAAGLKNVRTITSVQVPGGGGGGTIPSASQATAPIAPALPLTQTVTQLQSGTINQLQSATARAYVVESDVTGAQERIRRLNRAARLG
jgi:chromosome segregation ATPase